MLESISKEIETTRPKPLPKSNMSPTPEINPSIPSASISWSSAEPELAQFPTKFKKLPKYSSKVYSLDSNLFLVSKKLFTTSEEYSLPL